MSHGLLMPLRHMTNTILLTDATAMRVNLERINIYACLTDFWQADAQNSLKVHVLPTTLVL